MHSSNRSAKCGGCMLGCAASLSALFHLRFSEPKYLSSLHSFDWIVTVNFCQVLLFFFLMHTWYWLEALVVKGQNKQLWQSKKKKIMKNKTGTVETRAPSGKQRSLSCVWIQSEIQCDALKALRVEPDGFCSVWPSRLQPGFNYSSKFSVHLLHSESFFSFWVKSVLISILSI